MLTCENSRFSSLFAAEDVSRETPPAAKSEEKRLFSCVFCFLCVHCAAVVLNLGCLWKTIGTFSSIFLVQITFFFQYILKSGL